MVAAAVVAFGIGMVTWGLIGWGTPASNEQAIGEVSRWCERVSDGILREPVNALSNLAFVVSGFFIFRTLARDTIAGRPRRNRFVGNQPVALLYAAAVVFLGPGSMLMHGSHMFAGAWLDNVSMVAYILIPWLVNLAGPGRWNDRTLFTVYGSLLGAYAVAYWVFGSDLGIGLDLFGVSIGLWIISEVLHHWWSPWLRWLSGFVGFGVAFVFGITPAEMLADPGEYWWVVLFWVPAWFASHRPTERRRHIPWFYAGIAAFMSAYAIWLTGVDDHEWCRPDSLLQAHAIWHLLTAVATWCFFQYFRTGEPVAAGSDLSYHKDPQWITPSSPT
jgi:hypothetical protein